MMSVSINMVLNAENRKDFGTIQVRLMKQTFMISFSGILDAEEVEDQKMMKDKLIDGKKLRVDLEANQSI